MPPGRGTGGQGRGVQPGRGAEPLRAAGPLGAVFSAAGGRLHGPSGDGANALVMLNRLAFFDVGRGQLDDGGKRALLRWACEEKLGQAGDLVDFPVVSRTHAPAGTSGGDYFPNWEDALMTAGEQFRHFRASQPNQSRDANYQPRIETPEWLATVHRREGTRYPVGALGLPVGMKNGQYVVNADGPSNAEPTGRRSSPLWIRVVGSGKQWRLFSFAFQAEFLPTGVHLWHGGARGKALQVTDADVKRQTDQWIQVLREDKTFVPYRHEDGTVRPDESRQTGDLHS